LKRIILVILGLSFIGFLIIWGLLDKIILPSSRFSNIKNDEWINFIVTYSSGVLGGLIAIVGIWWQLNHEKKEKRKRVKKYIKHIIEENLSIEIKENQKNILYYQPYFSKAVQQKNITSYFIEFSPEYFNENLDTILTFKESKKIIKLFREMASLNILYEEKLNENKNDEIDFIAYGEKYNCSEILSKHLGIIIEIFKNEKLEVIKGFIKWLETNKDLFAEQINIEEFINDFKMLKKLLDLNQLDGIEVKIIINTNTKLFILLFCLDGINNYKEDDTLYQYWVSQADIAKRTNEVYEILEGLYEEFKN